MKRSRFPLLEIGITVLAVILVWLIGYPQYAEKRELSKRYRVIVNMYALRAGVENFAALNHGKFPKSIQELNTPLINSYLNNSINAKDITIFRYSSKEEAKNNASNSKNGRMCGNPGGLGYGYFICPEYILACGYGIIGFDNYGIPLVEKLPSGKVQILVIWE
ncbi:MAG: hypothetical protein HY769_05870 [Candidatus Stahlbacteria bacterium]|nr:hypothetical protein [Candidatus Stahlbacteria bacterium]